MIIVINKNIKIVMLPHLQVIAAVHMEVQCVGLLIY